MLRTNLSNILIVEYRGYEFTCIFNEQYEHGTEYGTIKCAPAEFSSSNNVTYRMIQNDVLNIHWYCFKTEDDTAKGNCDNVLGPGHATYKVCRQQPTVASINLENHMLNRLTADRA